MLAAETFDEALAQLRVVFNQMDGEAATTATGTPPTEPAPETDVSPGEPPAAEVAAPVAASAAPAAEPVKPPEPASGSGGEAAGEAKPKPEAPPEPTITIDPAEMAPLAVDAVDDLAVKELGAKVRLTPENRARLVSAMKPVLADFFRTKAGALRGLTPTENLLGTAAFIYGPALLEKYVFNEGAAPAPAESGPRLVPSERMA